MCLGVVALDGSKMPLYWFKMKPGQKGINQEHYIEVMSEVVLPWLQETFGDRDVAYCWQQDGAPCHTGAMTQSWCEENLMDFWAKDEWPSQSADANPLDYGVWSKLVKRMGTLPSKNIEVMKTCANQAWDEISRDEVIRICDSFIPRLTRILAKEGGPIEF